MSVDRFNAAMLTVLTFMPVIYMTVDRWWLGVVWLTLGVSWAASSRSSE